MQRSHEQGEPRRQRWRKATASCVLGLLSLFPTACDRGQHPSQIGLLAPLFTLGDGNGRLALQSLRGRVVLLNFWATWCAPCVQELPDLAQLQRDLPEVKVLGVATDQDAAAYERFVAAHTLAFTSVLDSANQSNAQYGTFRFPETYVIDKSGVIRRKFIGPQNWTDPEIEDFLRKLAS